MANQTSERRRYRRHELTCPVTIHNPGGEVLFQAKTANISDGGIFVAAPIESLQKLGKKINLSLRLPRSTPNTFIFEDFACHASIVRHEPLTDDAQAGIAMAFAKPLDLQISV